MTQRVILTIVLASALTAATASAGPPPPQQHITCVGDSITAGNGTSDPATKSYPAVLQRLFPPSYAVQNDGHSGATLLHDGDLPYTGTSEYAASTAWASSGGDVVIMLGTNDSKPQNWSNKAAFEGDCEALVEHYRAGASHPRVWVTLPPPAFSGACCTIDGTVLKNEVLPLLEQCAANKGVTTIDVYSAMLSQSAHFSDGVHPDDVGAAMLAQVVHDALVKLPTVTLAATTPSFTLPAAVTLTTSPTAAYGKVEQVELFEGATSRGTASTSPWSFALTNLGAGTHMLHAVVTETGGRMATSPDVAVDVKAAPPPDADAGSSGGATSPDGGMGAGEDGGSSPQIDAGSGAGGSSSSSGSGSVGPSTSSASSGGDAGAPSTTTDGGCNVTPLGPTVATSMLGLAAALAALRTSRRRRR